MRMLGKGKQVKPTFRFRHRLQIRRQMRARKFCEMVADDEEKKLF